MAGPGEIDIAAVPHGIGPLGQLARQLRIFACCLDFGRPPFQGLRKLFEQGHNVHEELAHHVVFTCCISTSAAPHLSFNKKPHSGHAMGFLKVRWTMSALVCLSERRGFPFMRHQLPSR